MREVRDIESGRSLGLFLEGLNPRVAAWLARQVDEADWLGRRPRGKRWTPQFTGFLAGMRYNHGIASSELATDLDRCRPTLMSSHTKKLPEELRAFLLDPQGFLDADRSEIDGGLMAAALTAHAQANGLQGENIVLADYPYVASVAKSLIREGWSLVCVWAYAPGIYSACLTAPADLKVVDGRYDAWPYASSVLSMGTLVGMTADVEPWEMLHESGVVGEYDVVAESDDSFWCSDILFPIGQLIPSQLRQPSPLTVVSERTVEDWPIKVFTASADLKSKTATQLEGAGLTTLRAAGASTDRLSRGVAADLAHMAGKFGLSQLQQTFEERAVTGPERAPSGTWISSVPRTAAPKTDEEEGEVLMRKLRRRRSGGIRRAYGMNVASEELRGARWLERQGFVSIEPDEEWPQLLLIALRDED